MNRIDGKELLNKWLSNADRKLQAYQEKEVLDKFAICGLPLYLKLAFEEARRWKSSEQKKLSPTVEGMILDMFRRLSSNENYGEKMFSRSMGYLAAAKNGLTEDELLDVLSLDTEFFDEFKKNSFNHQLSGDRLPVVVWSRLHSDLEPYLTERSADGTSLIGFYHHQLKEAVVSGYLKEDIKIVRHALLGHYFNGDFERYSQPLQWQKNGKLFYNLRKLSELPYQATEGELWCELEQTLTDIAFIEAKCGVGLTFNLIKDYESALDALPENREEKRKKLEQQNRVKKYMKDLLAFTKGEISSIEIIPSIKIWSEQRIREESERINSNPTRLYRIKAFLQFLNSESYLLTKFASFPGFCLQQAYNFAISGPVAETAIKRINAKSDHIMFLQQNFQRSEYNPYPALVQDTGRAYIFGH